MHFENGKVIGLAVSKRRGTRKNSVKSINLIEGLGIEGDGHRGSYRQISLLSKEQRNKITAKNLKPGDAAENILIDGIDNLSKIMPGFKIKIGDSAVLEVLQVGKEFHDSPIHEYTGKPVLPEVGVFCRVENGGVVKLMDEVKLVIRS